MKRLLTTFLNKWPDYLLEILVLIIGILGAFAVDNWNEERKESIQEKKIIKQLVDEYEQNIQQLKDKIAFRKQIIKNALKIYRYYDEPEKTDVDSLVLAISNIVHDPTFDPIDNDLLSTGNLRLIENEELRERLSNWDAELVELREMEEAWQMHVEEKLNPYLLEIGLIRNIVSLLFDNEGVLDLWLLDKSFKNTFDASASKKPVDRAVLLKDQKIEGYAALAIAYNQLSNFQSIALQNKMQETLDLLRKELEK